MQKYKTVLNALCDAKDIRTASDVVLLKYEKPANKSEAVKKLRASYGEKYMYLNKTVKVQLGKTVADSLIKQIHDSLMTSID